MATYFYHGSEAEIQPDNGGALQTLYLMNPSFVGYSETPAAAHQTNMLFLNSPLNSLMTSIPQQQPHQHLVGIPLQPPQDSSASSSRQMASQPDHQYNNHLWAPAVSTSTNFLDGQPQLAGPGPGPGPARSIDNGVSVMAQQGLSLSLTSPRQHQQLQQTPLSMLTGSKYLKIAQQLLDEVVSVGKGEKGEISELKREVMGKGSGSSFSKDLEGDGAGGDHGKKAAGVELSTAERQELQMKKAKLANMLDEVEQRYKQYHQQMRIVVSSFEAMAGFGSAKTYTSLALQTISKQFRCLRDAISGQIRATSNSLGEEDCLTGGNKSIGSRLKFVDHHLRQQRALQQLGMIQNNAWRPQRGLPERAVSVLRAWLFEHFLHPYPKDSDKHMLAKQTGLTRSQVSNWFINARVRLWKPMVEEMYLEETKEQEQNNGGDDKTSKSEGSKHSTSKSISQQANSSTPSRTEQNDPNPKPPQIPIHTPDIGMLDEASIMQQRMKKMRNDDSIHQNAMHNQIGIEMKPDELTNRELLMKFMDQGGRFGGYPIEQFAPRFRNNGVSLTLGLPHCESLSLSGSQQPSYLSNESIPLENNYFGLNNNNGNNPSASHPPNGYESINIQNRKRFAAQLLPDFVA